MRVAVLFGGMSAEREVSLSSGREIANALLLMGYEVQSFDVTGALFAQLADFGPDVVFIGLHGRMGEDGTIQGALEVLGYPYVGSGVLASALAMDKSMTKRVLSGAGIALAKDVTVSRTRLQEARERTVQLAEEVGWPLIIKPNQEGSTIGLTLAHDPEEAMAGLTQAFSYDTQVLVEQYVTGTEVTAVVVGDNESPEVLEVIEIIPQAELYDFDSKYKQGGSQHIMPARLSAQAMRMVKDYAARAYQTLGCRDYARVDFIVAVAGPVLLEVNTLPGMTPTSLVPDAARARGVSFGQFLDQLVQKAFQRAGDREVIPS